MLSITKHFPLVVLMFYTITANTLSAFFKGEYIGFWDESNPFDCVYTAWLPVNNSRKENVE